MSAALGAADRIGADMDRIGSFGAGADLAGARGAGLVSLVSDVLGTNLGDIAGAGIAEAKLAALDGGLSALAGPPGEGLLSATARLAEPSYWVEPSWVQPMSGMLGASEKLASMAKPGVLDGLGGAEKWRGFGLLTSPADAHRGLRGLDPARLGFDSVRDLSHFGKSGLLGDMEPGWSGAAGFYGAKGLAETAGLARGSAVFDGLSKAFDGVDEIARVASGVYRTLRPHLDWWGEIAEEAVRAARRIAAQPARPGDGLLAMAAHDALEAMERGRHWVAARFLEQRLNLPATPERLEAFWLFLKRSFERPIGSPPLWLTLEAGKARAYLATAIVRIAERIKRKRQMEDDIWGSARNQDGKKELVRPHSGWLVYAEEQPMVELAGDGLDPARLVALGMDERKRILDELAAAGTTVDKEIIGLIRTGDYDRADIRNIVGSTKLQAFERKIQRRMKILEN